MNENKENEKNIFYMDKHFIMMIETNDEKVKNFIKEMNRKRKINYIENMIKYSKKEGKEIKKDIEKYKRWYKVKCSVNYLLYFLNIAKTLGIKWVEIATATEEKPLRIGFLRKIDNEENKKLKTIGWIAANLENEQVL
jgi:isopropylmalate/homocitrate/citramalate synthase